MLADTVSYSIWNSVELPDVVNFQGASPALVFADVCCKLKRPELYKEHRQCETAAFRELAVARLDGLKKAAVGGVQPQTM